MFRFGMKGIGKTVASVNRWKGGKVGVCVSESARGGERDEGMDVEMRDGLMDGCE